MVTYIGYSTIDQISGSKTLVDVELAKRDLLNHFYTRRGERVGNPTFGSILPELVFEPLDNATIKEALDDYNRTGFGGWIWNNSGPIHGKFKGRFARLINGKLSKPL